ncbi:SMI1/KNR4 family protein [Streptomyces sp. NPDC005435]|uniref:SMI1/KNR4 family protein n=1 Tax=Streptomyces sp. NPDC005435 TaxID=3154464 RepID=UPI003451981D
MISATEDSDRLLELVRDNASLANHAGGCDAEMLAAAERELGVVFPPSYRRLIETFGTWDIAGEEFLGVYRTPAMGRMLLGSVVETLDARRYGMPSDLIVVMDDGGCDLIVLAAADADGDGEYPVFAWNPGVEDRRDMERLGDSFGAYALSVCERAVRNSRGGRAEPVSP